MGAAAFIDRLDWIDRSRRRKADRGWAIPSEAMRPGLGTKRPNRSSLPRHALSRPMPTALRPSSPLVGRLRYDILFANNRAQLEVNL